MAVQVQKFAFIITYGRSGSTFLQSILNTCENVDIKGENGNALFGLYNSYKASLFTKDEWGSKKRLPNNPWYGADLISPDKYASRLVDIFISEIMNPKPGMEIIGFKEIRYFKYIDEFYGFVDFIKKYFPGCRFLLNVRDAESVIKSSWWKNQDPKAAREKIERYRSMLFDYAKQNSDMAMVCDYEKYTKDIGQLREAIKFVGGAVNEERLTAAFHERLTH